MPKRLKSTFWTLAMQRKMGGIARKAVRASRKLLKSAVPKPSKSTKRPKPLQLTAAAKALKARKSALSKPHGMRAGVALGPAGAKRYYVYRPPKKEPAKEPAGKMPLVVMLHGCGQDARSFAASTRMNGLAAAAGCVVVYPEQDHLANVQGCWNWFDTRSGRALREAAGILAVVDQACAAYPIDSTRVVVAGMSAGAGMAALLALHHPERFAAVVMHSGVGPGLAHSTATALTAMRGHSTSAGIALPMATSRMPLPALLVIQGNKDRVVAPVNGGLAAQRWAATMQAQPGAPRVVQRGVRYPATLTDWKLGQRVVTTWAQVAGLGHAWSGGSAAQSYSDSAGPDASRMVLAFAQRVFAQRYSDAV